MSSQPRPAACQSPKSRDWNLGLWVPTQSTLTATSGNSESKRCQTMKEMLFRLFQYGDCSLMRKVSGKNSTEVWRDREARESSESPMVIGRKDEGGLVSWNM